MDNIGGIGLGKGCMVAVLKSRNQVIDTARAIAVILVVVGHCIQYGSGRDYLASKAYLDNIIFKYIYSFHMPLFAAISGICFINTLSKRTITETIKNRVQKLIIPLISWQMVINVINVAKSVISGGQLLESCSWLCRDNKEYVVHLEHTASVGLGRCYTLSF